MSVGAAPARGYLTAAEVARELSLSVDTVYRHYRHISDSAEGAR